MMSNKEIMAKSDSIIALAKENGLLEVASKILQKEGDTAEEAKDRLETFLKSLVISVNEPGLYAYHEYEDKAFHACLLDNQAFDEVCQKIFGVKIDHMSWARLGDELSKHQKKADALASKYKSIFGNSKMLSEGAQVICWDAPALAA
jgi:hypothetical protein